MELVWFVVFEEVFVIYSFLWVGAQSLHLLPIAPIRHLNNLTLHQPDLELFLSGPQLAIFIDFSNVSLVVRLHAVELAGVGAGGLLDPEVDSANAKAHRRPCRLMLALLALHSRHIIRLQAPAVPIISISSHKDLHALLLAITLF